MLHLTHLSRHCMVCISCGLARLLFASFTYSFILSHAISVHMCYCFPPSITGNQIQSILCCFLLGFFWFFFLHNFSFGGANQVPLSFLALLTTLDEYLHLHGFSSQTLLFRPLWRGSVLVQKMSE